MTNDEVLKTVQEGRALVKEATVTIEAAHDYVKKANKNMDALRDRIKMLTYEVEELKAGRGAAGTGWTREDGEEFWGEEAIKLQGEWWLKKYDTQKAELEELKWSLEDA